MLGGQFEDRFFQRGRDWWDAPARKRLRSGTKLTGEFAAFRAAVEVGRDSAGFGGREFAVEKSHDFFGRDGMGQGTHMPSIPMFSSAPARSFEVD